MHPNPSPDDHQAAIRYAALIRPVIGRVYFGVRVAAKPHLGEHSGLLPEIGHALLTRPRTDAELRALYRYKPVHLNDSLRTHSEQGVLTHTGNETWELTAHGRTVVREVHETIARTAHELWTPSLRVLPGLTNTLDRLITAAAKTGGPAFTTMAENLPDTDEPLAVYAKLAAFRHHRADAHAAAWTAAGLTTEQILQLKTGPLREAIEEDTNARDAEPYLVLSPDERLAFMSGLGSLPG